MYDEKLLQEIEEFAYLYMSQSEIAIITGANPSDLAEPGHSANIALQRGRLKRKAEFNGAVIKLTKQLSSPAMAIEQKLAEAAAINDLF